MVCGDPNETGSLAGIQFRDLADDISVVCRVQHRTALARCIAFRDQRPDIPRLSGTGLKNGRKFGQLRLVRQIKPCRIAAT